MKDNKNLLIILLFIALTGVVISGNSQEAQEKTETVIPTAVPTSVPTATPQPTQTQSIFKEAFMSGCNENGLIGEWCSCAYDTYVELYGIEALIQEADSSVVSDKMTDIAVYCDEYTTSIENM